MLDSLKKNEPTETKRRHDMPMISFAGHSELETRNIHSPLISWDVVFHLDYDETLK